MKKNNIKILILCAFIILFAIFYKMKFCSYNTYKGETDNWIVRYEVYDEKNHTPYILASVEYKCFDENTHSVDFKIECVQNHSSHEESHCTLRKDDKKYKFKFNINHVDSNNIEDGYVIISWGENTDKFILGKIK